MPYDEKRPTGVAGNLRVMLPLWLLGSGLAVIGLLFLARDDDAVAVVVLAAAGAVLVAGLVVARALSGSRADREG